MTARYVDYFWHAETPEHRFGSLDELATHIAKTTFGLPVDPAKLTFSTYHGRGPAGPTWEKTYLVKLEGFGVVGFIDELPTETGERE